MDVLNTSIKDCFIIQPSIFKDERGYFMEAFHSEKFQHLTGIKTVFIQDNESMSNYGVIRGLHAQKGNSAQAKLVRVTKGRVQDVVVDARPNSPTFGNIFSIELNSDIKNQLYIPKGCLHGFSVLEDETIFTYKCDNYYCPENEFGIHPLDTQLDIDWKIENSYAQISIKDQQNISWLEYVHIFLAKNDSVTVSA